MTGLSCKPHLETPAQRSYALAMPDCAACGEPNPEGARFCNACGAVFSPAETRKTRKTVTVLFADMVDSTSLGEGLDPEIVQDVRLRYFDAIKDAVERHDGTVEKFIGDAVMAVFGIPQAHEDDALRAVRAAEDAREGLALVNDALEREHGLRVATRIGLATGPVLAGNPGGGQPFATGDAVNVAARLQQCADVGDVLIDEQTLRLIEGAVRVESKGALELKGKKETVAAYRLRGVVPGPTERARRLSSPLIGREHDRVLLDEAYRRAVAEDACHLFTVLGAAGVGKSRLVDEFLATIRDTATIAQGRCLSYGRGITFWPAREAVKNALGLHQDEPVATATAKIEAVVADDGDAALITQRVLQLSGWQEPATAREDVFWAVRKFFEQLARRAPLVVVFDDIHWAEPTFLDLVDYVAEWSRDVPMLLVCMARPELLDRRPSWGGGKLAAISVLLEPLKEEECDVLITNLLHGETLEAEARIRIAEATEHNPLFIEEFVATLVEEGVISPVNGSWVAVTDVADLPMPPTSQALLAARVDALRPRERLILERASVIGKLFHLGALAELLPRSALDDLDDTMAALMRKDVLCPDRSSFLGDEAFRFRHLLLRDAAYGSLAKEARAELHERCADWFDRKPGEYEQIVGYHLEQAARYRRELSASDERADELAARAADRLVCAGDRAFAHGDDAAAAALFEHGVSLYPRSDPRRRRLLPDLARALEGVGRLHHAAEVFDAAVEEAHDAGDAGLELHASIGRLRLRSATDPDFRSDELMRVAESSIPIFEQLGDERGVARAWVLLTWFHWNACRFSAAAEAAEQAVEHAGHAADARQKSEMLGRIALAVLLGPTPADEALVRCREIGARADGSRLVEASVLRASAVLTAMGGDFDEARSLVARAREILDSLGRRVSAAGAAIEAGKVELLAGDAAAAERVLRPSFEELERMGEGGYLSLAAALLAVAVVAGGRAAEGEELTYISERAASPDDLPSQVALRIARAAALRAVGDFLAAESFLREALRLAEASDDVNSRADALLALGEILQERGCPDDARNAAEGAVELYARKRNMVMLECAQRAVSTLAAAPSPTGA
jgi:class 3 adenylate cyclase/tetratricopeptide (TPR) repeat protein